jgi:hypothetical protein
LIAVASLAILAGAEKIIAILPRNIWIWKNHYPTYDYPAPPPSRSWRDRRPSWGSSSSRNSGGHSVSSRDSTPPSWWRPSTYMNRGDRNEPAGSGPIAGGTNKVARGGGHVGSPVAGGTGGRVAVGGGHDRRTDTTPQGNVIPGSRGRK